MNIIKINSETVGVLEHTYLQTNILVYYTLHINVNQVNTNLNALNWMIKLTQKFN